MIPPIFIGTDNPSKMNAVFEKADLYVLEGSVSDYQSDDWWKRFGNAKIINLTGINQPISDEESYCIYSIDGKPVKTLQKGVKIIRYPDGTTKKIYVK